MPVNVVPGKVTHTNERLFQQSLSEASHDFALASFLVSCNWPNKISESNAWQSLCDIRTKGTDHKEACWFRVFLSCCSSKGNTQMISGDNVEPVFKYCIDVSKIFLYSWYGKNYLSKLVLEKNKRSIWMQKVTPELGMDICLFLPVIHAVSGCDTRSCFFNKGKITPY